MTPTNKIITLKLMNGDELVGLLTRIYDGGSIVVNNVMEVREDERGFMMRAYLLSTQEDLVFGPNSFVTYAETLQEMQEIYLDSEQYWPANAYKAFIMGDRDSKKRTSN